MLLCEAILSHIFQVELQFIDNALKLIATKALVKNTGAQGLRALLENTPIEAMFEVQTAISLPSIIYRLHLPLVLKLTLTSSMVLRAQKMLIILTWSYQ